MKSVQVRGIEIVYTDTGRGAPIMLLHGYPLNHSMWDEQVAVLGAKCRVIAPDLRGHGATTATPGPALMEEMAQDVAALMDELNIERAVVGGLSMGGYVAFAFYHLFRERVRALILADTRPGPDTPEGRRAREEMATRALKEGMSAIADAILPKTLAPQTLVEQPEKAARVRKMIMAMKPEGAAAALRGMALRKDHTALLPGIVVPTLILVGREDSLTPPGEAETMHRAISNSHMHVIEGAGHISNIERPAEFNYAVTDFLNTLEP